ncbi:ATP-dependent helicase, partial [Streptomyces sp. NPDC013455]
RPGEAELHRITGARTPSGVPVVVAAPAEARPAGKGSAGRHHRSRSAARGRRPAPRNTP